MGRFFKRDFNTLMRNKNLKNCKGLDFGGKENREKHLECTNIRKKKKRYGASKLNGQDALPIVAKILCLDFVRLSTASLFAYVFYTFRCLILFSSPKSKK